MNLFKRHANDPDAPEKTALVVDDSRSARYAMRKLLEGHAYTVDTAESAQDAYVYLQRRRPSVIFLDHQMPGCDGLDMLRELKRNPDTRSIAVIICSADEDDTFRQRARSAGAFGVLPKPPHAADIAVLLDALEGPKLTASPTSRRTPEIGRTRIAPGFAPTPPPFPPAAARAPSHADTERSTALEEDVAALRRALAARPAVTVESLLPQLRAALEPLIKTQADIASRQVLADLLRRLADGLGDPPD